MQEIHRLTPKQRQDLQVPKYRDLIKITTEVIHAAQAGAAAAQATPSPARVPGGKVDALIQEITAYGERAERVVNQARRRVLEGQAVPTEDKIFSIFEPHTDLIKRGKAQKPVEFGHKVLLSESGRGLITEYRVLDGNPTDDRHVAPSLTHHLGLFGAPPALTAHDRGFYSLEALRACQTAGVTTECIPQRGGRKTPERAAHENSRAFRRGQRFRAGIEGRISVLFRGRGMKRCLLHGRERFEVFVGLAVLANNLLVLADLVTQRAARRRRAA
jgi:IS5 family transposase